jgi:hypothetical protein
VKIRGEDLGCLSYGPAAPCRDGGVGIAVNQLCGGNQVGCDFTDALVASAGSEEQGSGMGWQAEAGLRIGLRRRFRPAEHVQDRAPEPDARRQVGEERGWVGLGQAPVVGDGLGGGGQRLFPPTHLRLNVGQAHTANTDPTRLGAHNTISLHLYSARALAQEGGRRDEDAARHLYLADRSGPHRVRYLPMANQVFAEHNIHNPKPNQPPGHLALITVWGETAEHVRSSARAEARPRRVSDRDGCPQKPS